MNFPFSPAEPAGFVVNFYVADRAALNVTDQPEQCPDVFLTGVALDKSDVDALVVRPSLPIKQPLHSVPLIDT